MRPIVVDADTMLAQLTQAWVSAPKKEQDFALNRLRASIPGPEQSVVPGDFSTLARPLFAIRSAKEVEADFAKAAQIISSLDYRLQFIKLNNNNGMITGKFETWLEDTQANHREYTLTLGLNSAEELRQAVDGKDRPIIHMSLIDQAGNLDHRPEINRDCTCIKLCLKEMLRQLKAQQN